jgi:oligopeptide/dipeptide ABC transporter ATP-binding protein
MSAQPQAGTGAPILQVDDLRATFDTEGGVVRAVDGVSFELRDAEVLAIVGESGSGKTATSLALLDLLPKRVGKVTGGSAVFDGIELTELSPAAMRAVRGDRVAMIFQDALTALNPVHRIGKQISEMIRIHRDVSRSEAWDRSVELLELVGIPNASERASNYVHEFSGGMRQRAMIAMAIALEPEILIADEPTTALDVTVQAQVLDVLLELRDRMGMAIILITHDLGVVARAADRVMVMYGGRKIEEQVTEDLFASPIHPYTKGLLRSMPRVDAVPGDRLIQIPGAPPSLVNPSEACRFAPRCEFAREICREQYPATTSTGSGAQVACHAATDPSWETDL